MTSARGFLSRSGIAMLFLSLTFTHAVPAFAHKDDYIDETLVFLTLERHEIEPEYWLDYGYVPGDDHYIRHNASLEYGITDRLMVEGRATWLQPMHGDPGFDSMRLEFRRRVADEGTHMVDVAFSGEVNIERTPEGARHAGFEPRLIFSKDVKERLNLTLNIAGEFSTEQSFTPAAGARWNLTKRWSVGSEAHYTSAEHNGALIPQVWLKLPHDTNIKAGYLAGFGAAHFSGARLAFEFQF